MSSSFRKTPDETYKYFPRHSLLSIVLFFNLHHASYLVGIIPVMTQHMWYCRLDLEVLIMISQFVKLMMKFPSDLVKLYTTILYTHTIRLESSHNTDPSVDWTRLNLSDTIEWWIAFDTLNQILWVDTYQINTFYLPFVRNESRRHSLRLVEPRHDVCTWDCRTNRLSFALILSAVHESHSFPSTSVSLSNESVAIDTVQLRRRQSLLLWAWDTISRSLPKQILRRERHPWPKNFEIYVTPWYSRSLRRHLYDSNRHQRWHDTHFPSTDFASSAA